MRIVGGDPVRGYAERRDPRICRARNHRAKRDGSNDPAAKRRRSTARRCSFRSSSPAPTPTRCHACRGGPTRSAKTNPPAPSANRPTGCRNHCSSRDPNRSRSPNCTPCSYPARTAYSHSDFAQQTIRQHPSADDSQRTYSWASSHDTLHHWVPPAAPAAVIGTMTAQPPPDTQASHSANVTSYFDDRERLGNRHLVYRPLVTRRSNPPPKRSPYGNYPPESPPSPDPYRPNEACPGTSRPAA